MVLTRSFRGKSQSNGGAVLMARIVDRTGRAIRPAEVAAIRYSIGRANSLRRMDSVELDVGDVMFEELHCGGRWSVDNFGYNFRHEMTFDADSVSPQPDKHFEVRYTLTATSGEVTNLRFQLAAGCSRLDSTSIQ